MIKKADVTAADFLPKRHSLQALRSAAKGCEGCHLYKKATQTVFGEGRPTSKVVIVGEIPGDKEDKTGRPFTGPAGTLLRQSIQISGMDLEDIYFTNVVKHFKFEYLNKRRMHRSPQAQEIHACLPWLKAEIEVIQPKVILCLGAVAAKVLVNKKFQLRKERGKWFKNAEESLVLVTFHPSAILRAIDDKSRHEMKGIFIKDLRKVAAQLKKIDLRQAMFTDIKKIEST